MAVFVITIAYDYEGERPLGVAGTLERAKAIAEDYANDAGYGDSCVEWAVVGDKSQLNGSTVLNFGTTQFVIREETVQ